MKRVLLAVFVLVGLAVACGTGFNQHTADDVVAAFQAAGLEAEDARPMTADDYGLAPYVGEGVRFGIPSLGGDKGGRVIAVGDDEEREQLAAYYQELGRANAAFFSWVFVRDNIVLQLNGDLPEAEARQYEAALESLE